MKRPPSVLKATLSASGSGSAFLHTVNRDADHRYRVIIIGGEIAVYDAVTGDAITVATPAGLDYIVSDDPENDFRAVTVGDDTYIVNRRTLVKSGATKSPALSNEALVSIRAADFATYYGVTLDGHTIQYNTPDGSSPHDRSTISTEHIASGIKQLIDTNPALAGFVTTQYGSTLHMAKADGTDFTISASDGLADQGILAIKGSVQRFDDLPERAKKGFTVEITGDPGNKWDNYFVTYDDNGAPNLAGVWRESVRPGILTDLDAATMPWLLSLSGALLDGTEAKGIPSGPVIADVLGDQSYARWDHRGDTGDAGSEGHYGFLDSDPNSYIILNGHLECFTSTLSALDGDTAQITFNYDVNTQAMVSGSSCVLEFYVSPTAAPGNLPTADFTLLGTRQYNQGVTLYGESYSFSGPYVADTKVEIRLRYLDGADPAPNKVASFRLPQLTGGPTSSIVVTKTVARSVEFDTTAAYPEGATLTITTGGGDPTTYTLPSDMYGDAVAAAITGLFTGATATVESPGTLYVAGSGVPSVAITIAFDAAHRLYNPGLGLVPNALAGKTIENLSDGSSGIIASNTASQVVVVSLLGGSSNVFAVGDVCRVVTDETTFTFAPALWTPRTCGDLDSNPYPSFVGRAIQDVYFYANRLGFVAGQNVILSRAGQHLQFFRQTATDLLPDDLIDVQSTQQASSNWHSVVQWGGLLTLWCDEGQYVLVGEPALSPQSVGIKPLSQFTNSRTVIPATSGRRVFFSRARGGASQVFEYAVINQTGTPDALDTTVHIPTYLKGSPLQIVGDATVGFLAVRTTDAANVLYVQQYQYDEQRKTQEAWSRWVFEEGSSIVAMDMLDGILALVVRRDGGVYLEQIDLVVPPTDELSSYYDGRTGTSGSYEGHTYESRIDLSTIYYRELQRYGSLKATRTGRLVLRYLAIQHHNTRDMTVTVASTGRAAKTYAYTNPDGTEDGILRVPIAARNTEVAISISNTGSDGFRISGFDWEGTYQSNTRRV